MLPPPLTPSKLLAIFFSLPPHPPASRRSFVCLCAAAARSWPSLFPVAAEGPDGRLVIA